MAFQPVPKLILFGGHLLIEGRVFVGIHLIAPPVRGVWVSFRDCAAPGVSDPPAPRGGCSWQASSPAQGGSGRPCSAVRPARPAGRTLPANHPQRGMACPPPPRRRPAAGKIGRASCRGKGGRPGGVGTGTQ